MVLERERIGLGWALDFVLVVDFLEVAVGAVLTVDVEGFDEVVGFLAMVDEGVGRGAAVEEGAGSARREVRVVPN